MPLKVVPVEVYRYADPTAPIVSKVGMTAYESMEIAEQSLRSLEVNTGIKGEIQYGIVDFDEKKKLNPILGNENTIIGPFRTSFEADAHLKSLTFE